jgi:hypothetical protein
LRYNSSGSCPRCNRVVGSAAVSSCQHWLISPFITFFTSVNQSIYHWGAEKVIPAKFLVLLELLLPPNLELNRATHSAFWPVQSAITKVLTGPRVRSTNWRANRGDWRAASVNTSCLQVKKANW